MQQGNFINVFLARHVSSTYAHHQEQWMLSCSIWLSAPSFWMDGGLESRCVGRVCGADGAVHSPHFICRNDTLYWSCPVMSRITWSRGSNPARYVQGRSRVQTSTQRLNTLTDISLGTSHSLREDTIILQ